MGTNSVARHTTLSAKPHAGAEDADVDYRDDGGAGDPRPAARDLQRACGWAFGKHAAMEQVRHPGESRAASESGHRGGDADQQHPHGIKEAGDAFEYPAGKAGIPRETV